MEETSIDNLKTIKESNRTMLEFFNNEYVDKMEHLQSLKSQQFELGIKIDELGKTLDVYSFKTSTGHNVFSPFSTETSLQQEKATYIQSQLKELMDKKDSTDKKVSALDSEVVSLKEKIYSIHESNKELDSVIESIQAMPEIPDESKVIETQRNMEKEKIDHGLNILRLQNYEKTTLADTLDKELKDVLEANARKLEIVAWLLKSDVNRAKVTLSELIESSSTITKSMNDIVDNLRCSVNPDEPIWTTLKRTISDYKEAHPECDISSDIDCADYSISVDYIITKNLVIILKKLFDNIFKHSNASRVILKISITSYLIDVFINDNGVGIDSSDQAASPWHSGLHQIQEIVYLLGGNFSIDGDLISGTNVKFSFPINS